MSFFLIFEDADRPFLIFFFFKFQGEAGLSGLPGREGAEVNT